ncbi:hypothetical protein V2J09_020172 [Rumex salicifolius]
MVSSAFIRFVVGILGNVVCLFLFLSPLPTFFRIYKKGSVGQYSAMPYLVTFLNSMTWVLYAIPVVHPHSTWLLTVNSTGCVIEFAYLLLFVIYSNDKRKRLQLISFVVVEILFVGSLAALVLTMVHTTKERVRIVGTIGLIAAILMYASPLSVVKMVFKTKSVEYMPFFLSLASFSNAIIWTIYGLEPFDPYVLTPSALGVLFGLFQLILYGVYYRSTMEQKQARCTSKTEIGFVPADVALKDINMQP